jgi:hypothetical protein
MKFIITESQGLLIIEAPHTFWTDELLKQIASMYKSRGPLQLANPAAYIQIKKRGLLDSFYPLDSPHIKWTPEKIKDESSKYNTTQEFLKNNPAAYAAAKRRGMLNDLFVKPLNKWNPNTIKQESSKYKTKKEFEIGNQPAYVAAHRLNMMDDLFPGKLTKMKGKSKYSDDLIKDVASNYISSNDFRKNEPRIWASAYLRNMIPNLFPKIK